GAGGRTAVDQRALGGARRAALGGDGEELSGVGSRSELWLLPTARGARVEIVERGAHRLGERARDRQGGGGGTVPGTDRRRPGDRSQAHSATAVTQRRSLLVAAAAEAVLEALQQAHVDLAHARLGDAHHLADFAHRELFPVLEVDEPVLLAGQL